MPKNGRFMVYAGCLLVALASDLGAAPTAPVRRSPPYTIDHWDTDTKEGLPNNEVIALTQTRDGYLWLGTLNGLVRFDGLHFTVFDENNTPGLRSSRVV